MDETREVLAELVALKDMKDRLRNLHEMGHGTDYTSYHERQPKAWAAARAALAKPPARQPHRKRADDGLANLALRAAELLNQAATFATQTQHHRDASEMRSVAGRLFRALDTETAPRPATSEVELPPLPPPMWPANGRERPYGDAFSERQMHDYARSRAALSSQPARIGQEVQAAQQGPVATRQLVEQCRDALAEELSAWDIDPPLHHVQTAHDACVAWLSTPPAAPAPEAGQALTDALAVLDDMLDAQSNPARRDFPTIHDYGRARRVRDALKAATPPAPAGDAP